MDLDEVMSYKDILLSEEYLPCKGVLPSVKNFINSRKSSEIQSVDFAECPPSCRYRAGVEFELPCRGAIPKSSYSINGQRLTNR
jgi:hypothetical protein